MNVLAQTPIYGLGPETPLSELTLPELEILWDEVNRNRDPLAVIALMEGKIEPQTAAEISILDLGNALRAHGVRPFESVA